MTHNAYFTRFLGCLVLVLAVLFSGAVPAQAADDPLVFHGDGDPVPLSLYQAAMREATAAARADADSSSDPHNCHSKVQKRGDGWGQQSPTLVTPYGVSQKYTHLYIYSTLVGPYCPNGPHPNKFYSEKMSHCYTWQTDRGQSPPYWWYRDTRVNANIYEMQGGRNVNPPAFYIGDDNTRQNCRTQKISSAKSGWIRTGGDHDPRWRQRNLVRFRDPVNDVEFIMRGINERPYNKLDPGTMIKLGGWRNP